MSSQKFKTHILKLAPLWALLGYGTWSAVINYYYHADNFLLSGLAQGSYAFITTLILRLTVLRLYKSLHKNLHAKLFTYALSFALMVIIPFVIHFLIDTQEIFYSILPGAIMGGIYLYMILKFEVN
jgi:hypothetical protein